VTSLRLAVHERHRVSLFLTAHNAASLAVLEPTAPSGRAGHATVVRAAPARTELTPTLAAGLAVLVADDVVLTGPVRVARDALVHLGIGRDVFGACGEEQGGEDEYVSHRDQTVATKSFAVTPAASHAWWFAVVRSYL
jgi:hypothetical protein